jgi:signal transduction histidine kinase
VVLSVVVALGDEWQGRFVICDPSKELTSSAHLEVLRHFGQRTARSIHAAHLCLRACREAAAEERSRLARELHDGTIQSLLGVELRLESLRRNLPLPEIQKDIAEVQGILRREATDLRKMVNETRRRALRPERLLEFLSDLLERFQRETASLHGFSRIFRTTRCPRESAMKLQEWRKRALPTPASMRRHQRLLSGSAVWRQLVAGHGR